ncbi:MAG TPA: glucans biosynthesis glucosyltransferase MdoH [Gemmataceae bacterium]|nr:glucans biosynthesis glucosyltransferase MdoH [Gemmataceae bacterium]
MRVSNRRALITFLTLAMTGLAAYIFGRELFLRAPVLLAVPVIILFIVLFFLISLSFWLATVGFVRRLISEQPARSVAKSADAYVFDPSVRTAILMPVYNEDPSRVLAGLRATYESLAATGHGGAFDFFLLSDTTDPDLWLAEEVGWAQLRTLVDGSSQIFYRHRAKNVKRKAGNIGDFCERWGHRYRYMVVLDADSVMSGATLVEMVHRMEVDPDIGILQVPPVPVNRVSLFARCQQFAAYVYGPVFLEGFAWWSHADGNYWGHNAIIRVEPFTRHCDLPTLPGAPPFGGEILSHDFVEAALMRRAGLKVCLAEDLDGSYEESPPTLLDFARRDQRWCQGNLHHLRLIFGSGFLPMSRMHFGMGAMAYLSSPLWMLFMILSTLCLALPSVAGEPLPEAVEEQLNWTNGILFVATMTLMLLPKLWGYILLLGNRKRLAGCGGPVHALGSIVLESLLSILVAPIMMAFHVVFVSSIFLGFHVGWGAQERSERGLHLAAATLAHWKQMLAGLVVCAVAWLLLPATVPWLAPVFIGLIFAIPLSMTLSSVRIGQAMARLGILITPAETLPPPVLERLREYLNQPQGSEVIVPETLFPHLLADPALRELHRSILLATHAAQPAGLALARRAEHLIRIGAWKRMNAGERKAVQGDPELLDKLHLLDWNRMAE